jgi:hypothetical protein
MGTSQDQNDGNSQVTFTNGEGDMGIAYSRHIGAVTTEAAIDRARKAWRGQAALMRGVVRERGHHGPLEVLDRAASGSRSVGVPTQLTRLAIELRDVGCSAAEVRERLHAIGDCIVALTFTDGAA